MGGEGEAGRWGRGGNRFSVVQVCDQADSVRKGKESSDDWTSRDRALGNIVGESQGCGSAGSVD
jgi:hypothetical protein